MNRIRWGDHDRYYGPITHSRDSDGPTWWNVCYRSGDSEDRAPFILLRGFGHTLAMPVPAIIPPYRHKVHAKSWSPETIQRMGRDWYWDYDQREFGISLHDGFLQVHYGRQSDDSRTERRWGYFLPWTQWRHIRQSWYGRDGQHIGTLERYDYQRAEEIEDSTPKRLFTFLDYDGEQITATTHIEEREWRFGTGYFRWFSWFRLPRILRSLDVSFSSEVGQQKGSWKGGTRGHSIEMRPGELHGSAFRRYCRAHDLKYLGEVEPRGVEK